jgi:hypothetical protein
MWDTCDTCDDKDADGYYAGCNSYIDHPGTDCDDAEQLRNPGELEIADDGLDNDCSGNDLLAATGLGIYIADGAGCSDTAATRGSINVPYCTVTTAWMENKNGDFFIAEGTYYRSGNNTTSTYVNLNGDVRIQGGYEATGWTRDIDAHVTTIDTDGFMAQFPLNFSGNTFILNGIHWQKPTSNYQGNIQIYVSGAQRTIVSELTMDVHGQNTALYINGRDVVVRDNVVYKRSTHVNYGIVVNALEQLTIAGNTFDLESQYSRCGGLYLDGVASAKNLVVNNTLRCVGAPARGINVRRAAAATILNNSIHVEGTATAPNYNSAVYAEWVGGMDLVNNAISVEGADSVVLHESATTALGTISMVNNFLEVYSGTGRFAYRQSNSQTVAYDTASDVNNCVAAHCGQSGDNALVTLLFSDVDTADFSAPPGGSTVDAGIDPSPFYNGFEIYESLRSTRPQDGDGASGAQWDVGALEKPNPGVN